MVLITSTMSKPFNAILNHFKKYYGLTMNNVKFHFPEEMKDITYIWNSPLDKQA